jgi:hypothetical protein
MMIFEGKKKLNYKDLEKETGVGIPTLKVYNTKGIIQSEKINGEAWFNESAVTTVIEWRWLNIRKCARGHKTQQPGQESSADRVADPPGPIAVDDPKEPLSAGLHVKQVLVRVDIPQNLRDKFALVCEINGTTPARWLKTFIIDQVKANAGLLAELQRLEEERKRLIREYNANKC